MIDHTDVEQARPTFLPDLDLPLTRPRWRDYAKAFLLNFALYAAAILVYAAVMPGKLLQVIVLVLFSLYVCGRGAALIRPVERQFQVRDRELLFLVVEDYLKLRGRWKLTNQNTFQRHYEMPVLLGLLYRFPAALLITLEEDHAILRGHALILRRLAPEIARTGAGTPIGGSSRF